MPCWLISLGGLIFSEVKKGGVNLGERRSDKEGLGGEKGGETTVGM